MKYLDRRFVSNMAFGAGETPAIVQYLRPLQVDAPARVLRSTDEFGVLNLIPTPTISDTDVSDAATAVRPLQKK